MLLRVKSCSSDQMMFRIIDNMYVDRCIDFTMQYVTIRRVKKRRFIKKEMLYLTLNTLKDVLNVIFMKRR